MFPHSCKEKKIAYGIETLVPSDKLVRGEAAQHGLQGENGS